MNERLQQFVADTDARFQGRLRSPRELLDQHFAADQALDAAVIGGYGLRDILAGKVRESEISPVITKAFHLQYPHAGSFVDFVRDHRRDTALLGIINGIKGKAFELEYADYLNHGHLPPGAFAELAHSPTQEGWDIAIRDSHGDVIDHLQLKATDSLSYIQDAIAHHPEIDVVATHEVFKHLHDPEIVSHLIDSGISNVQLEDVAADAVHDVAPGFDLIPWLAFGVIAFQSWRRYRGGAPLIGTIRSAFRRGSYSIASRGMAYFTTLLGCEPFVGTLTSVLLRLGFSRYDAHKQFIEFVRTCRMRTLCFSKLYEDEVKWA
jgi:hypothetical protein